MLFTKLFNNNRTSQIDVDQKLSSETYQEYIRKENFLPETLSQPLTQTPRTSISSTKTLTPSQTRFSTTSKSSTLLSRSTSSTSSSSSSSTPTTSSSLKESYSSKPQLPIQDAVKFVWPSPTRQWYHQHKPYFSPSKYVELNSEIDLQKSYDEIVIVWRVDGSVGLFVKKEKNKANVKDKMRKKIYGGTKKFCHALKNFISCNTSCFGSKSTSKNNNKNDDNDDDDDDDDDEEMIRCCGEDTRFLVP
ncbi:hypothetical protein G9A89_002235 [Geosiphon pyriformis]|nr:hypothetical protein G9A89_002235 [Geosiphon pyriformis]